MAEELIKKGNIVAGIFNSWGRILIGVATVFGYGIVTYIQIQSNTTHNTKQDIQIDGFEHKIGDKIKTIDERFAKKYDRLVLENKELQSYGITQHKLIITLIERVSYLEGKISCEKHHN